MKGTCVHLWLIRVDAWEKPAQHRKEITLQLKKIKTGLWMLENVNDDVTGYLLLKVVIQNISIQKLKK